MGVRLLIVGALGLLLDAIGVYHYLLNLPPTVCFNTASERFTKRQLQRGRREWGNPHGHPCVRKYETHHYRNAVSDKDPWRNSCKANMVAWTKKRHEDWHAEND